MALSILRELLQDFLTSLLEEGILNNSFCQKVVHGELEEDKAIVEQICTYCNDMETIFSEMDNCIKLSKVDFSKLAIHARAIEDKSSRMGAEYVKAACEELIQSCLEKDKKVFSRNLTWLKHEYDFTKEKLEAFAQMEQRIIRVTKQKQAKERHNTT